MSKLDPVKKAQQKYRGKSTVKTVSFGPNDRALTEAIKADKEGFTPLVRRLLCEHYGLDSEQ